MERAPPDTPPPPAPGEPHQTPALARWTSLAAVFLGLLGVCLATPFTLVDDAYISFRHAANLVQHGQFVFNLNERVEGITNLLWSLLLAGALATGATHVERLALLFSLGALAWMTVRLWQLAPRLHAPHWAGALASLLVLLNTHFVLTATNGLEAGLYAALLTELLFQRVCQRPCAVWTAAALLFLTRPEGAAVGAILILYDYARHWNARAAALGLAIVGGTVLATTVFRLAYYGQPLPNSVLAKSFPLSWLARPPVYQAALAYLGGFASEQLPLLAILAWGVFRRGLRRPACVTAECLAIIALSSIIALRNAGDWMAHHRLLIQYAPLYAILLVALVGRRHLPMGVAAGLVAWTALSAAYTFRAAPLSYRLDYRERASAFWQSVTHRLAPIVVSDDRIAAEAIGYIAYHLPQVYVHDPFGLTDAHLARYGRPALTFGKMDLDYTLRIVRPTVLAWHFAGHLLRADPPVLANYIAYCAADCDSRGADVVMIRRDAPARYAAAFADWPQVSLGTDGVQLTTNPTLPGSN